MHTKCIRIMYATFDGTRSGCSSGARARRNPCGTGASTGAYVAATGSSNREGIGASWSSSTRSGARVALLPRGRPLGLAGSICHLRWVVATEGTTSTSRPCKRVEQVRSHETNKTHIARKETTYGMFIMTSCSLSKLDHKYLHTDLQNFIRR